jgi:hypothetical protein
MAKALPDRSARMTPAKDAVAGSKSDRQLAQTGRSDLERRSRIASLTGAVAISGRPAVTLTKNDFVKCQQEIVSGISGSAIAR